ncbi:inositol phosphate phosphatase SopB, partial [Desulfovibrio sp.]|uniref:inositol phosphate phosphatase SopB n=1 Tax=Desulfovibrio sp. TaxID=885 RepID=UPI002A90AA2B
CGKAEGTRLFNQYIGKKSLEGKAFTGGNLSRLLDAAAERNLACLGRGMAATGRRALRPELMAELGRAGVDPDYFVSLVSQGVRLVGNDFWGQQSVAEGERELASVSWAVDAMHRDLEAFQAGLPAGAEGVDGVLHCLEGLKAQLDIKRDIMAAQKDQSPFTAGNVRLAFQQTYAAYERVIGEHVRRTGVELGTLDPASDKGMRLAERARDLSRLMAAMQDKMTDPPELRGLADGERVSDAVMKSFNELPGELGKELHRLLPDLSAGKLAREIKEAHIQVLNEQAWGVIRRDLQYLGRGGAGVTATSTITPACHIGAGAQPGPIGRSMARHGINGVSCEDRGQPNHALNLARTEIAVGGNTLFRGLRHGINSAYSIKNPAARRAANATRATEIFTAALQSSPKLADVQRRLAVNPDAVIDLPLLSTSLVTPDVPREIFGTSEKTYLAEQCASWKDACGPDGTCTVNVVLPDGQERAVKVRPQVLTFNFGVNTGAQGGLQGLIGGWGTSDRYNREAMALLFGDDMLGGMVETYLARSDISARDRQNIQALRYEIHALWAAGGYRMSGADPYRLPARLAMLGHIMGMMPLFNCKSGKDRTGQMDVACKTLALQMHENGGLLPPFTAPRSSMDQQIFQQVALNGGNLEMQRLNTGLAGFKTKGVAGLDALFTDEAREIHRGLSSYVKA